MSTINEFCLRHHLHQHDNPCIAPDACLDWPALRARLVAGSADRSWTDLHIHEVSRFAIAAGQVVLVEDQATGDHAWLIDGGPVDLLAEGQQLGERHHAYPATWGNLLVLKNLIQSHDPDSTIFPTADAALGQASLGIGARFTTLHWPAVFWTSAALGLPLTANQNSIPRELVYDTDAMLGDRLMRVPFPFIGCQVPEGHQGQSVQGMSQGAVLAALKTGFHRRRLPWGFNADHQPIGGQYDARETQLVAGALLASYITYDISPELSTAEPPPSDAATCTQLLAAQVPAPQLAAIRARLVDLGLDTLPWQAELLRLWPALLKMQRRDRLYAASRAEAFSTTIGRAYHRELSVDELPGLTAPATLAAALAACEALDMPVRYVAPAFGFQKNCPFDDGTELERRITAAWEVCRAFAVSIGFHSGSGKSADNYRCCGRITDGQLEIKTSGRYTYEMGRALAASSEPADQALWRDWYGFTRSIALRGAFADDSTEREMARVFIRASLAQAGRETEVFADPKTCADALEALEPDPEHMLWFEYNFLFVLAAGGAPDKEALGDHGPDGYHQRARFYRISPQARLAYARNVASYICFLAETTGLAPKETVATARSRLERYDSLETMLADLG